MCVRGQVPVSPIGFVFPGQGSQAVGMLKDVKDIPAVKEMLTKAQDVLGYDLLEVCTEVRAARTATWLGSVGWHPPKTSTPAQHGSSEETAAC